MRIHFNYQVENFIGTQLFSVLAVLKIQIRDISQVGSRLSKAIFTPDFILDPHSRSLLV